jgi:hypothetical protein
MQKIFIVPLLLPSWSVFRILGRLSCLLLLISLGDFAYAQINIRQDTLVWHISSIQNAQAQTISTTKAQIITYGSSKIDWIQKQGKKRYTYTIQNTQGNWTNPNTLGEITQKAIIQGLEVQFIFKRDPKGLQIRLYKKSGNTYDELLFTYFITHFVKQ